MTQKAPGVTGLCVRSPTIRYTICMIILTQPTSFRTLAAVYSKSQQISRKDSEVAKPKTYAATCT